MSISLSLSLAVSHILSSSVIQQLNKSLLTDSLPHTLRPTARLLVQKTSSPAVRTEAET